MIRRIPDRLGPAALVLLAFGCGNEGPPGAGLTNGPPPTAESKPAMRTDLPDAVVPRTGEALGKIGDNSNDAGTGGRGSGSDGGYPEQPKPGGSPDSVRADPPRIEAGSPSTAAGGTKPADKINTGTPRSPQ
jgi:hypothetical protein